VFVWGRFFFFFLGKKNRVRPKSCPSMKGNMQLVLHECKLRGAAQESAIIKKLPEWKEPGGSFNIVTRELMEEEVSTAPIRGRPGRSRRSG